MDAALAQALALLEQCANQLQRTGGMLNKDLAKEVTKFVSGLRAATNLHESE